MLTVSRPYEVNKTNGISNAEILPEQFNDLKLKCDALEHKYKRIKLENEEYKKMIEELQQQNEELMQETINYQNTIKNESHLIPFFENHLSSIQTELNDDEQQIVELNNKLNEYKHMNQSLQSENIMLKQENDSVRNMLQQQQTQISQHNSDNDHAKYQLLNENQLLRDELSTVNKIITSNRDLFTYKHPMDTPSHTPSPELHHDSEDTVRFDHVPEQKSPTLTYTQSFSHIQQVVTRRKDTLGSVANFSPEFLNFIHNVDESNILTDELTQKIDKLEMENQELLQKWKEYEEKYDIEMAMIAMVNNTNENDEIKDMEELFKKCEYEILNDNLIKKFRVSRYEIQLRKI